jgi:hypothetical protein
VLGLANLAGEASDLRDAILMDGVVPPLLGILEFPPPKSPALLSQALWLASNLCCPLPDPPPFHHVRPLVPSLLHYLSHEVRSGPRPVDTQ